MSITPIISIPMVHAPKSNVSSNTVIMSIDPKSNNSLISDLLSYNLIIYAQRLMFNL